MDLLSARNCRICLSQCETRDLDISEFATKYVICTGFQITESDIPKKICSTCTSELIQASNFQAKCQETEKILVNLETKTFQSQVSSTSDFENPEPLKELDIIEELINNDTEEYEKPVRLTCDFCQFEVNCYKDIHKLKMHVTKVHQKSMKEERCTECPLIFPVKSLLKLHITDSHTPNNVKDHFSCSFCSTRSLRQESILNHLSSHHKNAERFTCVVCRRQFRSMDHLRWHLKHSKCTTELLKKAEINFESTLNCDFCGFSCALEANMEHHVMKMHGNEELRKCFCGERKIFCRDLVQEFEKFKCNASISCKSRSSEKNIKRQPKLTKEIDGLTAPERKKMRQNELVECETCHEKMKRASLARHMKNIHQGVKFMCQHCDKPYTLLQNLKLHIAKHHMNLKTEYPCQYCDRKFNAWASRYYHQIRVHTKNFKYFCEKCNKHFMHEADFEDHNSIHTGVKLRECDECGEKFHTRNWLRTHKETEHSKEPPVKCNFCGNAFQRKRMLQRHLKQIHGTTDNKGYRTEMEYEEEIEEMDELEKLNEYEEAERDLVEFIEKEEMKSI